MSRDDATFKPSRNKVLNNRMVGNVYRAAEFETYSPTSKRRIEKEILRTSKRSRSGVGNGIMSIAAMAITNARSTTSEYRIRPDKSLNIRLNLLP
jgi:hypothetical protein